MLLILPLGATGSRGALGAGVEGAAELGEAELGKTGDDGFTLRNPPPLFTAPSPFARALFSIRINAGSRLTGATSSSGPTFRGIAGRVATPVGAGVATPVGETVVPAGALGVPATAFIGGG